MDPVERELREYVQRVGGLAGLAFRKLSGEVRFWPGSAAVGMPIVEDLDSPRRCETIAVEAAERFGFSVVFGWMSVEGTDPVAHYWNLNDRGEIIDAANRRRTAAGHLGKTLTESELATVSRFSIFSAVG